MLKIAKKADLWAKRELRFTAGSQGHTKKHRQARIIQSSPFQASNSEKMEMYQCSGVCTVSHQDLKAKGHSESLSFQRDSVYHFFIFCV